MVQYVLDSAVKRHVPFITTFSLCDYADNTLNLSAHLHLFASHSQIYMLIAMFAYNFRGSFRPMFCQACLISPCRCNLFAYADLALPHLKCAFKWILS